MTPTLVRTLRIDEDQWAALQLVEARDGVPISEQVRRALAAWLAVKGVTGKPAPRKKSKS